jgi:adenylate kinase family enzyme
MKRVVILGRGASGKSSLARTLRELTGLPLIELDKVFWQPGLQPAPPDKWARLLNELVKKPEWIMDGDLGPYDVAEIRIREADTIILLAFPLVICAWRALRRSRERVDFWQWLFTYRRKYQPALINAFANRAPSAELHVFRSPKAVREFIRQITLEMSPGHRPTRV